MKNDITEVMKPIFDSLNIDPIEFDYIESKNQFVTKESFEYSEDDPEAYYIVVKLYENTGTILLGTSDGVKFYEQKILGQISYDNDKWTIV